MAQGIYDLLQETLKLTTNLNKQLCCNEVPITTTTTVAPTTTTTLLVTSRKAWIVEVLFAGRSMTIPNKTAYYTGNTVANITALNPDLILAAIFSQDIGGSFGINISRTISESVSSPFTTVTPTYTFNDGNGFPILRSIKQAYAFWTKVINDTFLSTRNAQIVIKRVSIPVGGTPSVNDGCFLIAIEFDSTNQERDGYTFLGKTYDFFNIPGTVNPSSFTYTNEFSNVSGSGSNFPMFLASPSSTWVNNVTVVAGATIREDFPIPLGW
jgi:hypothetical protein